MKKKVKEEKKEEIKEPIVKVIKEVVEVIDTRLIENLRFEEINKFVSTFHNTLDNSTSHYKVYTNNDIRYIYN